MSGPPRTPSPEPPTAADIEEMAHEAFATIPEALARHVRDVVIRVDEFPDEETMREMALETPFDILGLYRGVSIDRKSVTATPDDLDMIFLYRRPLLDYWVETGAPLFDVVRHVLIHEVGHHFGLTDAEMARIEGEA